MLQYFTQLYTHIECKNIRLFDVVRSPQICEVLRVLVILFVFRLSKFGMHRLFHIKHIIQFSFAAREKLYIRCEPTAN